jgi:hypothetical protein
MFLAAVLCASLAPHGAFGSSPPSDMPTAGGGAFDRAVHYENGESVRQNKGRALALYCDAARKGDTRAFLDLAWIFMNGRGVARNDRVAVYWLRKAAASNVPQAVNLLQVMPPVAASSGGCTARPVNIVRAAYGPSYIPDDARSATPPAAYQEAVEQAARDAGIGTNLLAAIVAVESGYNADAVSPKGAMGLTQLMPGTASRFGVQNPFDYRENLRGGATYLRSLLDLYGGDLSRTLAAYNAGEGAVESYGGIPPFAETEAYVRQVQQLCNCAALPPAGGSRAGE